MVLPESVLVRPCAGQQLPGAQQLPGDQGLDPQPCRVSVQRAGAGRAAPSSLHSVGLAPPQAAVSFISGS